MSAIKDWSGAPKFEGATCNELHVETESGVHLRVLQWKPDNEKSQSARNLVMIPGWNSIPEGWFPILSEWVKHRPLIYIETREKRSCRIESEISKKTFQIPRMAADIPLVLKKLGVNAEECDMMGSSLGATLMIECLQSGELELNSLVVLSPNLAFKPPIWARPLIPAPTIFYSGLVKFIIWYLDKRLKEEGQRIRYRRTLLAADTKRLRLCSLVFRRYKMALDFANVTTPVGVLRASSDTLHDHDDAGILSKKIPNCSLIEIESNQFAHEAAAIPLIENFQRSVG